MDLERSVQYLLDRQEIQDVIARYSLGQDSHQGDDGRVVEEWSQVFTEDAVLDFSSGGYPSPRATYREIAEWMRGENGNDGRMSVFSAWQHHMAIPNVRVDGDTATATTDMWCTHRGKPDRGRNWYLCDAVVFRDRFARTPDGWRITHRHCEILWIDTLPAVADPSGDWEYATA